MATEVAFFSQQLEIENVKSSKTLELISGTVKLSKVKKLQITAFYRPPSEKSKEYQELVTKEMSDILNQSKNTVSIIGGDFNLPDINWKNCTIINNDYSKDLNETFMKIANMFGLEQIVDFPTRTDKKSGKENTLDLIFTSHPSFKTRCKPLPAVGNSDHDIVMFDTALNPFRSRPPRRKIILWKKADIDGIKSDVKAFVDNFVQKTQRPIEIMWEEIKKALHAIIEKRVPSKLTASRHTHPWINTEIRRAIRRKQRAHAKARKSKKKKDHDRYKRLQKEVKFMIRIANKSYVESTVNEAYETNNKKFWGFVKSKKQESTGIPPLKNKDGYLKSDSASKAEILNEQFQSVFTNENTQNMPNKGQSPFPSMQNIKVTSNGVIKLLSNLKINKATGPDLVPAFVLKTAASEIAPALTILFQQSLDTGIVPTDWKNAWVVPIFKKGEKHQASNYRPVSLTSITCKVLEHIVHSNVMQHFDQHHILNDCQHGFRRRRSCESQLIVTCHEIARNLANGKQVDVILLDFSKAFDKVPHQRLLHKLAYYGVKGSTLQWIGSFLADRKQEVLLEGVHSSPANVTSGVPQGTVLGPLLFLSYINDLPDVVQNSSTKLFADDCLLFRAINNARDQHLLQSDLTALERWESEWQMEFNPSKCTVIQISNNKKIKLMHYNLHGEVLQTVEKSKYLGVTFNNRLTWSDHIDSIATKANKVIGFIRRNLQDCNTKVKSASYTTLVRPILEYSSAAWDPHLEKDKVKLENVQRHAARFVMNDYRSKTPGCVSSMIEHLKWENLETRRRNIRLNLLQKINSKLVDIDIQHYAKKKDLRTRGAHKFYQEQTNHTIYFNSFFPRTIRDWNRQPSEFMASIDTDQSEINLGGTITSHQLTRFSITDSSYKQSVNRFKTFNHTIRNGHFKDTFMQGNVARTPSF